MKSKRIAALAVVPVLALAGCSGGDPEPAPTPSASATPSGAELLYENTYGDMQASPLENVASICELVNASNLSLVEYAAELKALAYKNFKGTIAAEEASGYGLTEDEYWIISVRAYRDFCAQ